MMCGVTWPLACLGPLCLLPFAGACLTTLISCPTQGFVATMGLMSQQFVWPGLAKDCKWCRQCVDCGTVKVSFHAKVGITKIPVPACRFSHVLMDLVSPWPVAPVGSSHLLAIIDHSTRCFVLFCFVQSLLITCSTLFSPSGWHVFMFPSESLLFLLS